MSLRALLLGALTYVLLLTIIAFAVPLGHVLGERTRSEVRAQARAEAELLAAAAGAGADGDVLSAVVDRAARSTRGRVIVVDGRGRLRVDSAAPPAAPGSDYATRPEVAAALRGSAFQQERRSESLGRPLLVTAVPVLPAAPSPESPAPGSRSSTEGASGAAGSIGVVRVSQDVGAIARAVDRGRLALVALGLIVLAIGGAAAAILARRLTQPLVALQAATEAVAAGDMTAVAPERGSREQLAVARAFNAMTGRLDRTLTAQQQFVANASHQLRTPLTGVRLRVEEALAEQPTPEAQVHLTAAMAEVDRLSTMIDDLLRLSRSEERPQSARPVDLVVLAGAAAERIRASAQREGRTVEVRGTGPSIILADAPDVERILDALLENALAYGRGPIEIAVRGERVEVGDRGPGLAPGEDDGRLLERFGRGSAGRRRPGTGLGLAIAHALAARWGGTVSIAPREGGGAVAVLDLTGAAA